MTNINEGEFFTDSELLTQMMGMNPVKIELIGEVELRTVEAVWRLGGGALEFWGTVYVTETCVEKAGWIYDEGYQRPEPAEYKHDVEIDSELFVYLNNESCCSQRQIKNIIIPILETKIELNAYA